MTSTSKAVAIWPERNGLSIGDINGIIHFEQLELTSGVLVTFDLKGFLPYSTYAVHIHEGRFRNAKQLEKGCMSLKGHFNPFSRKHGSIHNDNPNERHVGDLCNNITSDSKGQVKMSYIDPLLSLDKKAANYIGNRSVVIHTGTDDLGRQGRNIYAKGLVPYNDMTPEELRVTTGLNTNGNITKTDIQKLIKDSLVTGNAGGRMACTNIEPLHA